MNSSKNRLLFDIAVHDLDSNWITFLDKNGFLKEIQDILSAIESDYYMLYTNAGSSEKPSLISPITSVICPEASDILTFAKFPLEKTKIIIIGQDPYPRRKNAHGLAFSVRQNVTIPASLSNIYVALLHQGLISSMPTTGNLNMWSQQGVVLLNMALTTIEGETGKHLKYWRDLTKRISISLGKEFPGTIYFLFGNYAQEMKSLIPKTCVSLEWGHPSPLNFANKDRLNPKNFINCDVFLIANNMLSRRGINPINWDPQLKSKITINIIPEISHVEEIALDPYDQLASPNEEMIYAFVDGAAKRNGRIDARAAYAVIIVNCTTMFRIIGQVEKNGDLLPTNNRAELMALKELFIYIASDDFIRKNNVLSGLTIVYDSAYAAGCLREWYTKWCKLSEKPEIMKKNLDIISNAHDYMTRVQTSRSIYWQKVDSHELPPQDEYSLEWYYWYGNKKVDESAQSACEKNKID